MRSMIHTFYLVTVCFVGAARADGTGAGVGHSNRKKEFLEAVRNQACLTPEAISKRDAEVYAQVLQEKKQTEARLAQFSERLDVIYEQLKSRGVPMVETTEFDSELNELLLKVEAIKKLRTKPMPTEADKNKSQVKELLAQSTEILNSISINVGFLKGLQTQLPEQVSPHAISLVK